MIIIQWDPSQQELWACEVAEGAPCSAFKSCWNLCLSCYHCLPPETQGQQDCQVSVCLPFVSQNELEDYSPA